MPGNHKASLQRAHTVQPGLKALHWAGTNPTGTCCFYRGKEKRRKSLSYDTHRWCNPSESTLETVSAGHRASATKLVSLKQFPSFLFPKVALKNTRKVGLPVRKKPDHTLGHITPIFEVGFSSPLVYPVCNSTAQHRAQPGSTGTWALWSCFLGNLWSYCQGQETACCRSGTAQATASAACLSISIYCQHAGGFHACWQPFNDDDWGLRRGRTCQKSISLLSRLRWQNTNHQCRSFC